MLKCDIADGAKHYYYPVTNSRGDIMEIHNGPGQITAKYNYDAWGKLLSVTDANGNVLPKTHFAYKISVRYRGYEYDAETGLYYLQSRYYDPETGRFINADDAEFIGLSRNIISFNAFTYCESNPVRETDYSGYWFETVLDVASIGWSIFDLFRAPSWYTLGNLAWDIAATFIPFAPGSYVKKGAKVGVFIADKASDFNNTKSLIAGTYKGLKKLFKGIKSTKKIEIHHLIEKRFAKLFKVGEKYFLSVPIEKELHKTITKRWRNVCKYRIGSNYSNITKKDMKNYIRAVYYDMPKLRDAALKWLNKYWKG